MPQPDRCIARSRTAACPHGVLRRRADSAAPVGAPRGARVGARHRRARAGRPPDDGGHAGGAVERDRIFYDESGGGVTFSGGEPLLQPEFVLEAAASCRAEGIHVAVDTCGHVDPDALLAVAREADLFLFDLKTVDEAAHRRLTGVPNDLILSNLERLAAVHPRIIVRFPLIPGVNDDEANVRGIGALLASYRLTRVDVLPYHRAGLAKYHRLQQPYALEEIEPPSPSHLAGVVKRLAGCGLIVGPS